MAVIPAISASERLDSPTVELDELLGRYEAALGRLGAIAERSAGNRLVFAVPWTRPKGLSRMEADLGLVADGFLDVTRDGTGYEVRITARPRGWLLLLSLLPWALLVWALGWTSPPWHWLLAFGGLPLPAIAWVLVWANLSAFLGETNARVSRTDLV